MGGGEGREARKKIRKRERPLGGEDIWGLWEEIKTWDVCSEMSMGGGACPGGEVQGLRKYRTEGSLNPSLYHHVGAEFLSEQTQT